MMSPLAFFIFHHFGWFSLCTPPSPQTLHEFRRSLKCTFPTFGFWISLRVAAPETEHHPCGTAEDDYAFKVPGTNAFLWIYLRFSTTGSQRMCRQRYLQSNISVPAGSDPLF